MDARLAQHPSKGDPAPGIPQHCPLPAGSHLYLRLEGTGRCWDLTAWPFHRGSGSGEGCCHLLSSPNTTPGGTGGCCWQWDAVSSRVLGGQHIQLGMGQSTPNPKASASPSWGPSAVRELSPMLHHCSALDLTRQGPLLQKDRFATLCCCSGHPKFTICSQSASSMCLNCTLSYPATGLA